MSWEELGGHHGFAYGTQTERLPLRRGSHEYPRLRFRHAGVDPVSRRRRISFAVVLVVTFMAGLDGYIVNLALPTLVRALSTSVSAIQWVTLAYLLAITALVASLGRAVDLWSARRVLLLGLGLFTVGSALAGLAPSLWWLVGFRTLQGTGAAMLLAAGQALVTELYPAGERGRALGWLHAASAAGFVTGPTLGGLLLATLSWHWIFWVNVPLGLGALALGFQSLPARSQSTFATSIWRVLSRSPWP